MTDFRELGRRKRSVKDLTDLLGDTTDQLKRYDEMFVGAAVETQGAELAAETMPNVSGGGERISLAVLRNGDTVTGIRFLPLHPPNGSKSIWQRIRLFHPQ